MLRRKSISFWFETEVKTAPFCWHISMAVERFTCLILVWKHFDSNRIQLLEEETEKNDGKMKMMSSKKRTSIKLIKIPLLFENCRLFH